MSRVAVHDRSKVELMRSLNEGIALVAGSFASDPTEEPLWDFACECGRHDCREWVELELPRYEEIRRGPESVLADGHVVRARRARTRAAELCEEAEALRGQARQQTARAGRHRSVRH
jgi:hypothetical protein